MSTARHTERVPGLRLRVARMQRGLAQRDVARQLGVSPRRISSLEGAAFVPSNTADRYFDALEHLVPAVRRAALGVTSPLACRPTTRMRCLAPGGPGDPEGRVPQ